MSPNPIATPHFKCVSARYDYPVVGGNLIVEFNDEPEDGRHWSWRVHRFNRHPNRDPSGLAVTQNAANAAAFERYQKHGLKQSSEAAKIGRIERAARKEQRQIELEKKLDRQCGLCGRQKDNHKMRHVWRPRKKTHSIRRLIKRDSK